MNANNILEIGQMYNGFTKRGTVVYVSDGALRRITDWYEEGYSRLPDIIIRAFQKVQTETFTSGEKTTLVVTAPLRFHETDVERKFTILRNFVPQFSFFAVITISGQTF
jgi:hypothetical protein